MDTFGQPASSSALYEDVRLHVRSMLDSDEPREVVAAETWRGLLIRHHPTSELIGCDCAACGDPWPCKPFLDTVRALN